jgi:cytochrome c-type biogenesis protein
MEPLMIWIAFIGGALSFLSPCILPIAPGYLAIVSGVSLNNLRTGEFSKKKVLIGTMAFVLGFTVVFITLGIGSSFLGQFLRANRNWLSKVSGLIVIILGLHQAGWLKISFLYRERRLINNSTSAGSLGPFLAGLAFSLGWTPCVGPVLGSILALAGNQGEPAQAAMLLGVYSLGLGMPFFLLALAFQKFSSGLDRIKPYFKYIQWISGLLLILMGILLLTGGLTVLSAWLIRITGGWSPESLIQPWE